MCGRFYLKLMADEVAAALGASVAPEVVWQPRYNIAPTQDILIVRQAGDGGGKGGRELIMARWGLVPRWAEDPSMGNRLINARSESAQVKPAFREAFSRRRCLIPASGFFEWQKGSAPRLPKRPFRVERPDGGLLTMAGLWETWHERRDAKLSAEGSDPAAPGRLRTATILTTDASPDIAAIHDRMPLFLEGEAREAWLDPDATPEQLAAILKPAGGAPEGLLVATEISRAVNKPEHDDPSILDAVEGEMRDPEMLF